MKDIRHSTDNSGSVLVLTVQPSNSRSVSPSTRSQSREIRGLRLFRAISRKLGRRSNEDLCDNREDDSRYSSTDSCSSTSTARCSRAKVCIVSESDEHSSSACGSSTNLHYRSHSPHIISPSNSSSNGSSDNGSETREKLSNARRRHHHSTTAASLRKAFEHLTISTRSQSCDNTQIDTQTNSKDIKRKTKKSTPKRILRAPVTYSYVRGLSGLPTQRIPRYSNGHYYTNRTQNGCYCGHQYLTNLNRY